MSAFDIAEYRRFIAGKGAAAEGVGFARRGGDRGLKAHQIAALDFACEKGRSACFLDTGLGKSRIEAAFADEARAETGKPSLILTPLAVARQMQRECEATDVDARVVREDADVYGGVNIANYERLDKLDISRFGCIVLDESSILKSFTGPTKRALVASFAETPYRLAATATPAPNDHMELGSHSEFLGILSQMEMLCRWFINDTSKASQEWRVKGHAEDDFWRWVASWSRSAAMPSDLGGDDAGYDLPPLRYHVHAVEADLTAGEYDGLFRTPDNSATAIHKEKRLTMGDRVARAAEIANGSDGPVIVWCETNAESTALARAIPDAIEVFGSMKPEEKERALDAFTFGERRVIVTKPKLAGFGLNWQHAPTVVFASISHSYEQHYQAIRRSWRFGQTSEVNAHVIIAETERPIWSNVRRKAADHDTFKRQMIGRMIGVQSSVIRKVKYTRPEDVTLPAFMEV